MMEKCIMGKPIESLKIGRWGSRLLRKMMLKWGTKILNKVVFFLLKTQPSTIPVFHYSMLEA
jgi:hypothetical protein